MSMTLIFIALLAVSEMALPHLSHEHRRWIPLRRHHLISLRNPWLNFHRLSI